MLKPGDSAPDFSLPDHRGGETSLNDLLQAGPLVLYFYPADFTPVCTQEACMFRDVHDEIVQAGLAIAGVSPQSVESHARFAEKIRAPFPLLADAEKAVIKRYGANGPFGFGVRRVTYLIRPDKEIADAVRADLGVARHRAFIRAAIDAASV
ncbi:MAG: peroxiredoxin [Planctomycetota bacterium]